MPDRVSVAIVDYHMGNVLSVRRACETVGLEAVITSDAETIESADGVILPGVGAYGDAMSSISSLGLADVLRKVITAGKPTLGICLGMQLLMTESEEFGFHHGLNLISGRVVRLEQPRDHDGSLLKVPHIGWNCILPYCSATNAWDGSILAGISPRAEMYFVHSYYVVPDDSSTILSISRYGDIEFASTIQFDNLMACQYHPEKSGPAGLTVYQNFYRILEKSRRSCFV
jgi:glutamine amidotransferase